MTEKPRKVGRPRLSASPSADVHLTLAPKDYEATYRHAKARRESVQDVIRRGLRRLLHDERGGSF